MATLMIGPARQDSATVDETTVLAAGYTYFKGYRYKIQPEHPPLSQVLPAAPLLTMDLKFSDQAQALLDGRVGYPWTRPWYGPIRAVQELFPQGRENWYFWALPESQLFGQMFVYASGNDGDRMMFSGRCVQILLALGVGALIFFWVRSATANDIAALGALALWVFNPNALGYGHLITTDIGVTLGFATAVMLFGRFLEQPTRKAAVLAGAATGFALVMKLTAVVLGPVFLALTALRWKQLKSPGVNAWKLTAIVIGAMWLVLLMVYFPRWSPPPSLPESQAVALGVPGWFRSFRPLLIPGDFFKGLALTLGHSKGGHDAYLMGQWSNHGWWYYYPLAFFFKSPLAFVILTITGAAVFIKNFKSAQTLELAAWIGVIVFLALAMTSNVNIGVRHLLPIFPLLCVGAGCAVPRLQRWLVGGLVAWQFVVAVLAYPLYLQFFSEAVGGAQNGYKYLLDSNYDWGADAVRLKKFMEERGIGHIYLDYFGTQFSIEYLKIPNTRVNAEQARQIVQGTLVVSASQLMRPEWAWLRDSRQPIARVAHTLFVYQFP
jgi:hypothetical protein